MNLLVLKDIVDNMVLEINNQIEDYDVSGVYEMVDILSIERENLNVLRNILAEFPNKELPPAYIIPSIKEHYPEFDERLFFANIDTLITSKIAKIRSLEEDINALITSKIVKIRSLEEDINDLIRVKSALTNSF